MQYNPDDINRERKLHTELCIIICLDCLHDERTPITLQQIIWLGMLDITHRLLWFRTALCKRKLDRAEDIRYWLREWSPKGFLSDWAFLFHVHFCQWRMVNKNKKKKSNIDVSAKLESESQYKHVIRSYLRGSRIS